MNIKNIKILRFGCSSCSLGYWETDLSFCYVFFYYLFQQTLYLLRPSLLTILSNIKLSVSTKLVLFICLDKPHGILSRLQCLQVMKFFAQQPFLINYIPFRWLELFFHGLQPKLMFTF